MGIAGADEPWERVDAVVDAGATSGSPRDDLVRHARIFYTVYFAMTGLHALHMVIGVGILGWLLIPAARGRFSAEYHDPMECSGLYWHFVDIVWIFLFPLLYLIGRH
jgi:cytochrome c oxidase subunit 3